MFSHSVNTHEKQRDEQLLKDCEAGDRKAILLAFRQFNKKFKLLDKKVHETKVNESDYLQLQQGKPISPLFQNIVNDFNQVVSQYQAFMNKIQSKLHGILPAKDIQLIRDSLKVISQHDNNSAKLRYFPSYQYHYSNELVKIKNNAQQELETVNQQKAEMIRCYNERLESYDRFAGNAVYAMFFGFSIPIILPILLLEGLIVLTDIIITGLREASYCNDIQSAREEFQQTKRELRNEIKQSINENIGNQIHQRFFRLEKNKAKLEPLRIKETSENQVKFEF